jgi:hypothetical protein
MASFAVIVVASLVEPLWNVPGTTASGADVAGYLSQHRSGFLAALSIYALGMGLFLIFAAGLWAWMRQHGATGSWAAVFALGSASLATLVYAGFVPMLVLAYRAHDVSPTTAKILYDVCFGLLALSGIPTAVALGAFTQIVLGGRMLPRATAWMAAFAAAAHLVIAASFLPSSGFFSLEGGVIVAIPVTLFAWLIVTSTALVWRARQAGPITAA